MENRTETKELEKIIKKYPPEKRYTLSMMQDIQKIYNYIPKEALKCISNYVDTPTSKLYGIATFYKAFSLQPKGKNIIKVCDGTACHIRSSMVILSEIEKQLNIKAGETTGDGLFSLETVNCVGSCALAPVVVVNDEYYGKVTPQEIKKILEKYKGGGRDAFEDG